MTPDAPDGGPTLVRSAGFTVLGEAGNVDDVRSVWRAFSPAFREAVDWVYDTEDDMAMLALGDAWLAQARTHGLLSGSGEFLLSVESADHLDRPWMRVRLGEELDVSGLGAAWGEPEFVASDLARTVSIGVHLDNGHQHQVLLSHTDPATGLTPAPPGLTSEGRRARKAARDHDALEVVARSGLTVLGAEGDLDTVFAAWRAFRFFQVPTVQVPRSGLASDMRVVQDAWLTLSRTAGLFSASGEFLLSVWDPAGDQRPWTRVRLGDGLDVTGLGHGQGRPHFVASDLGGTVATSVLSPESEHHVLLWHPDRTTGKPPTATGETVGLP